MKKRIKSLRRRILKDIRGRRERKTEKEETEGRGRREERKRK